MRSRSDPNPAATPPRNFATRSCFTDDMDYTTITSDEFAALEGVDDWRVISNSIVAEFRAGSFPAAASLVSAIADAAESARHHPDVDLRYPDRVRIVLTTHAAGGLTTLDVA